MTPDEWKRIKDVAGEAWGQPPAAREAYVRGACAGDERLRGEVMTLLRSMAEAEGAFEDPIKGPVRPV